MSVRELSEEAIVRQVADHAAKRVTRRTVASLQQMRDSKTSGGDSVLENVWDEICVQVQEEEWLAWDVYLETIKCIINGEVANLRPVERDALWLQTDQGIDWGYDDGDRQISCPVCDEEIVDYLWAQYVHLEADRWSNVRIRAYLDRPRD